MGSTAKLRRKCRLARAFRAVAEPLERRTLLTTIVWDGGPSGNGTAWSTDANWVGDVKPGMDDDAVINTAGPTIIFNGTESVKSVTSNRAISMTAGTFTIAATSQLSDFALSTGTLTGSGDVTVSGPMTWSGGTMDGMGRTIIAATGTLSLTNTTHNLNRTLQNDGAATWTAGILTFNNGTINNNGSFTANSAVALSASGNSGANTFNNAGTFTKQGNGTTSFFVNATGVAFSNSGTVDVQGGTLGLDAGGSHTGNFTGAGTTRFNGTHAFTSATTLNLGNPQFAGGTSTLDGPGTYMGGMLTISGGTANFNSAAAFASSTISSGTLGGSGDVTVSGATTWSGGTMSGSGRTIIAANTGTLSLTNTTHNLSRTLQNDGAATWTGGGLFFTGGTIDNNGSFTANSVVGLSATGNGGVNAFNNIGTFTKQGSGTASFFVNGSAITFNNTGMVDVQSGVLGMDSGGSHTGNFTGAGTTRFNGTHAFTSSTVLSLGNSQFAGGTSTLGGPGTYMGEMLTVSGGTANFNSAAAFTSATISSGTLGGSGDVTVSGATTWSGGTMSGSGKTIIAATGMLSITNTTHNLNRILENNGAATWTAGSLNLIGGTLNNNGSFTANSDLGLSASGNGGVNTFNNAGTFTKQGNGTASFFVNGSALAFNNTGMVDVQGGMLGLDAGGSHTGNFTGAGTTRFNGTHAFTSATTLNLGNPQFAGGTSTLDGPGTYMGGMLTISGGTANFNSAAAFASSTISSGTLGGSGDVTVSGATTWSGGTMSGSGRTIIAANTGTLSINTTTHTLSRTLQNNGTANWTAGTLILNNGTIDNNGSFTANSDLTLSATGNGGGNAFNNPGTFTKQGNGTASFFTNGAAIAFNNSGAVDVQAGILGLDSGGSHTASFTGAGTVRFNGTHVFTSATTLNIGVNALFAGGTSTLGGPGMFTAGTLTLSGSTRVNLTPGGGKVLRVNALAYSGNGLLDLADNAMILATGSLTDLANRITFGRGHAGGVADGAWNGFTGITSSSAASAFVSDGTESSAVGYALNGDLPLGKFNTFFNQAVSPSDMLVRYTRMADATLDGIVNDNDVSIVAAFYDPIHPADTNGPLHWYHGDFNYDGYVDDIDVSILAAFYDPSAPALSAEFPSPPSAPISLAPIPAALSSPPGLTAPFSSEELLLIQQPAFFLRSPQSTSLFAGDDPIDF